MYMWARPNRPYRDGSLDGDDCEPLDPLATVDRLVQGRPELTLEASTRRRDQVACGSAHGRLEIAPRARREMQDLALPVDHHVRRCEALDHPRLGGAVIGISDFELHHATVGECEIVDVHPARILCRAGFRRAPDNAAQIRAEHRGLQGHRAQPMAHGQTADAQIFLTNLSPLSIRYFEDEELTEPFEQSTVIPEGAGGVEGHAADDVGEAILSLQLEHPHGFQHGCGDRRVVHGAHQPAPPGPAPAPTTTR